MKGLRLLPGTKAAALSASSPSRSRKKGDDGGLFGTHALSTRTSRSLQNLKNAKVVPYGYADNKPVGAGLKQAGIANNIDLLSGDMKTDPLLPRASRP